MHLVCETAKLEDYLLELNEVNFSNPMIKSKVDELFNPSQSEIEKAKVAYEFVRDEIYHSWDIQGKRVTCKASDVLVYQEGICYAKSNLLASLLRSQGIPTGFCYQRLMLFDTPEKGYCIHALNAIFLKTLNKWIRLDARGNKAGIDAQFSIDKEKLAFTTQEKFDEKDYPVIYVKPHPKTISVLVEQTDALEMYIKNLPEYL
ncbi:transglutaminase-like domain-containing protein [Peribacillus castrilensis]|uniref:Transglutaminase-like superfamily protein n=1 Tax=Peribacillus simplex TaxID=1478 RepID=A0AAN2TSV8_9BACI|nr:MULTISPECIES: transglutaminase family protein [Bacillaceae]MCP1096657.1 transglutaminase family protein [Bacillaceae bacterium OS4b]MBD8591701.1 transglutaminase family protein [Peribacillus simplex]MCF7624696.1 transglutaminase family protein [Peribacillus frigoritolerans]MEA3577803.1 transglutaminase family protein [Peribacillus frigoritolerans]NCT38345.1 transglutaminase family protein [Peribacillus frigoritolerans]